MVKKLAHVCIIVSNLERSIKFYTEIIGLKLIYPGKYTYLHIGEGTFLELTEGIPPENKNGFPHFCFEVDDIESYTKQVNEKGVKTTEIKLGTDESYQSWIEDPDGYRFELHQYTEKSIQHRR